MKWQAKQKSLQRPRLKKRNEKEDIMRDAACFTLGSKPSSPVKPYKKVTM
jgi:hypothetical protein